MSYTPLMVYPYSVWKCAKTDSVYVVIGIAFNATSGEDNESLDVVYISCTTGLLKRRKLDEFTDGRFQPMSEWLSDRRKKEEIKAKEEKFIDLDDAYDTAEGEGA